MKYGLLPKTMWAVFAPTFKKNLHIISAQNPNEKRTRKIPRDFKSSTGI